MNIESIRQFNELKRSKQFNILLSIFSSLISGFVIIFCLNPTYCKEANSLLLILLSFSFIVPIYILNQIGSVIIVSIIIKNGLSKLTKFLNITEHGQESVDNLIDYIRNKYISNYIYNSPTRQFGEIVTIISSYLTALMALVFNFSILVTYLMLLVTSISTFFIIKYIAVSFISELNSENLEPLISKLKNNSDFKTDISNRCNKIVTSIEKKRIDKELDNVTER